MFFIIFHINFNPDGGLRGFKTFDLRTCNLELPVLKIKILIKIQVILKKWLNVLSCSSFLLNKSCFNGVSHKIFRDHF
jgi:hypothetical protein